MRPPATEETAEPGHLQYRPDIDGLRGVAVLAVVAFHFFPEYARAGFVGVDVFFVISGFLITTIILRGLASGRFGFLQFYARRVRRIFPALIVVLATTAVAGWLFFNVREYKALGLHMLGGATFSSNFLLWQESGYFDVAAERKPLLHLWSLAIEEQFYLLFPLILWVAHRRRIRPFVVTTAIGLASFIANIIFVTVSPTAAFYSPLTRAWELMLGATLASVTLYPSVVISVMRAKVERWLERGGRRIAGWPKEGVLRQIASVAGAYLLFLAAILITKSDPFPGWYALLPTLGGALLIVGNASSWINRRILSQRVLVWFGLISFPLYLWHWPLLSFARVMAGEALTSGFKALLVAVSIVLAWLTYRFVEHTVRFGRGRRAMTMSAIVALACLGSIGASIVVADGFGFRPSARTFEGYLRSARSGVVPCEALEQQATFCRVGSKDAPPLAFVYGDSHADALMPSFAKYAEENKTSFIFAHVNPPLLGVVCREVDALSVGECGAYNREIFEYVKAHGIRNVVLAARWTNYGELRLLRESPARTRASGEHPKAHILREAFEQTVAAYREIGVAVTLVVDNPLQTYLPEDVLRHNERLDDETINAGALTSAAHAAHHGWMSALLHEFAGGNARILDFTNIYCWNGICPLVKDGKFLYADQHHLSLEGAMLVYPELKKALDAM